MKIDFEKIDKGFVIGFCALLSGILFGSLVGGRCSRNDPVEPPTPGVDTLYLQDSSAFLEPKESQPKVKIKEIPVPVFVADSSAIDSLLGECARLERIGDSLRLVLLREQKHYSDSTYDAWVSGVDPSLDSIKTYRTREVITQEIPVVQVKKTRWGIGFQAGAGVNKDGFFPYLGVGVSYNFLSW